MAEICSLIKLARPRSGSCPSFPIRQTDRRSCRVVFLPCVQGYRWGGGCWHKTSYRQERSSPKREETGKGEREGIVVGFGKPTIVYVTTHDDCTLDLGKQGSDVWRLLAHSKSAEPSSDSMCTDHFRHYNPMG